jgi:hypothetical protein
MGSRQRRSRLIVVGTAATVLALPSAAFANTNLITVPGTAVLLSTSGSGALSSTSSNTNIFSPAAYVDYKRFGGEPTVTVDRYPFTGVSSPNSTICPGGYTTTQCFKDIAYASAPNGFAYPHYSPFWKSDDLGRTFRVPCHTPAQGQPCATGGGGGDSHTAVGELTHRLFFVDLPGPGCITNNVSDDQGETFVADNVGCGSSPGVIDDRQWVEADETFPGTKNVYISFINESNLAAPSLSLARSLHDGSPGTFVTDSTCNTLNSQLPTGPIINGLPTVGAGDSEPTACPDPADKDLQIAGPVVADRESYSGRPSPTHNLYIPFVRGTTITPGLAAGPPYSLWVAKSTDGATTWTRSKVADLGAHNPVNLFPRLTIDRGGNLYYTWSQTQGPESDDSGLLGEQDVYYTFSTNGALTWAPPIPLTQETGDSAIMPWMVAGDPGQVDVVYYQSSDGLNSNVDETGVWNVIFGQSQNALNTGSNFKNVQVTDHPMHVGGICTAGLACSGDRDLLDFFTVDLDHLGAANVIWADDYTSATSDTRNKFSRQLSGASVYRNTSINLYKTWGITDHAVTDRAGDVFDAAGLPKASCPGMDLLATSENRSGSLVTISLTLNAPPTAANAIACGGPPTTGGLWGAEFWAAASGDTAPAENFYLAYRDNPLDGPARVEGGRLYKVNATTTSLEFDPRTFGTLGGTCFATPPPQGRCTISMTVDVSTLGIKPGAGLYSITGLATYQAGTAMSPMFTRLALGDSEQADAATPFDDNGTGQTP